MLTIAGRTFRNRLILGTGKYKDFATMKACYEAARVDMVTLAVRRFDLCAKGEDNILAWIPEGMALLPNTAGCYTGEEALRVCPPGPGGPGAPNWVKLEVIGDPKSLYPDGEETLHAAPDPRAGGLRGAALHQRRSHPGQEALRGGVRRRDAPGQRHRLRPGRAEPLCAPDPPGGGGSASACP